VRVVEKKGAPVGVGARGRCERTRGFVKNRPAGATRGKGKKKAPNESKMERQRQDRRRKGGGTEPITLNSFERGGEPEGGTLLFGGEKVGGSQRNGESR